MSRVVNLVLILAVVVEAIALVVLARNLRYARRRADYANWAAVNREPAPDGRGESAGVQWRGDRSWETAPATIPEPYPAPVDPDVRSEESVVDTPTWTVPVVNDPWTPKAPVSPGSPPGNDLVPIDFDPDDFDPYEDPAVRAAATAPVAWLHGAQGDYLLARDENTIGRAEQNVVVASGRTVGRRHCIIRRQHHGWTLHNGESAAPTYLNHTRLQPHRGYPLSDGDRIALGVGPTLGTGEVEFEVVYVPPRLGSPLRFDSAARSVSSKVNEDRFQTLPTILALADGVGGRPAGAEAAELAVHTAVDRRSDDLTAVVRRINSSVRQFGALDPRTAGLATTLDVITIHTDGATQWLEGAHVGDATVFLLEGVELTRLTTPHTLGQMLCAGSVPFDEVRRHPGRASLLQAIGFEDDVRPDRWLQRVRPGQRIVACTDGVLAALGFPATRNVLAEMSAERPARVAEALAARVRRQHELNPELIDDATVIVADVVPLGAA